MYPRVYMCFLELENIKLFLCLISNRQIGVKPYKRLCYEKGFKCSAMAYLALLEDLANSSPLGQLRESVFKDCADLLGKLQTSDVCAL